MVPKSITTLMERKCGSRQVWWQESSGALISWATHMKERERERERDLSGKSLYALKAHPPVPQWHASSSKATPPKLPHIDLSTRDQAFNCSLSFKPPNVCTLGSHKHDMFIRGKPIEAKHREVVDTRCWMGGWLRYLDGHMCARPYWTVRFTWRIMYANYIPRKLGEQCIVYNTHITCFSVLWQRWCVGCSSVKLNEESNMYIELSI